MVTVGRIDCRSPSFLTSCPVQTPTISRRKCPYACCMSGLAGLEVLSVVCPPVERRGRVREGDSGRPLPLPHRNCAASFPQSGSPSLPSPGPERGEGRWRPQRTAGKARARCMLLGTLSLGPRMLDSNSDPPSSSGQGSEALCPRRHGKGVQVLNPGLLTLNLWPRWSQGTRLGSGIGGGEGRGYRRIIIAVSVGQMPGSWLSLPQPSFPQGRPGEICVIGPKGQKVSCRPGCGKGVQ